MGKLVNLIVSGLLSLFLLTACAATKKIELWQDDNFSGPLSKTLILAVAKQEHLRNQLENVLADRLTVRGVSAVASHKAYPDLNSDTDRDVAQKKVLEMGFKEVLVIRSIDQREITNHKGRGVYSTMAVRRNHGWHGYYRGAFPLVQRSYDTEFFTLDTSLHRIGSPDPVWHYLSQVRVDGARQAAINKFVPVLVQQLDASALLP